MICMSLYLKRRYNLFCSKSYALGRIAYSRNSNPKSVTQCAMKTYIISKANERMQNGSLVYEVDVVHVVRAKLY